MDEDWEVKGGTKKYPRDYVEFFYSSHDDVPCSREKYIALFQTHCEARAPPKEFEHTIKVVSY